MSDILIRRLSSDLNIPKFEIESVEAYGSRLLYSALSAWAKVQLYGKSYTDIYELCGMKDLPYHNVDIMHIQTHLSRVAYGMLSVLPHNEFWMKNSDLGTASSDIASAIIEQLLFCYEISQLNTNRRLIISPERTASFKNVQLLLGGTSWQKENNRSVGLGRWLCKPQSFIDYRDVLGIPAYPIKQYYHSLTDNAIWRQSELTGIYRVFKIGTRDYFIKAWDDMDNANVPMGVSLVKDTQIEGGYFLLKRENDRISYARLDKWYITENEIYRIMYALNANNNTHTIFRAKDNIDHIILHCNSILPNAEMRILMMSSWPLTTYSDKFKRIVPRFLWDCTEEYLSDLGIFVEFVDSI